MNTVKESQVESRLRSGLAALGIECIKFLPFHMTGMPDRLVLLPDGRVHWVELKTDGGKLSSIQKFRHQKLKGMGHKVFVLWTKEDVDNYLSLLKSTVC